MGCLCAWAPLKIQWFDLTFLVFWKTGRWGEVVATGGLTLHISSYLHIIINNSFYIIIIIIIFLSISSNIIVFKTLVLKLLITNTYFEGHYYYYYCETFISLYITSILPDCMGRDLDGLLLLDHLSNLFKNLLIKFFHYYYYYYYLTIIYQPHYNFANINKLH